MIFERIAKCAALTAMLGMHSQFVLADMPLAPTTTTQSFVTKTLDVVHHSGTVRGQLLDSSGQPQSVTRYQVRHAGRVIAEDVSFSDGRIEISGLRSGVYEIVTETQVQQIRVWDETSAPPTARLNLIMVQNLVMRGQGAAIPLGQLAVLGVTGTAIGVGVSEANKDTNEPASP